MLSSAYRVKQHTTKISYSYKQIILWYTKPNEFGLSLAYLDDPFYRLTFYRCQDDLSRNYHDIRNIQLVGLGVTSHLYVQYNPGSCAFQFQGFCPHHNFVRVFIHFIDSVALDSTIRQIYTHTCPTYCKYNMVYILNLHVYFIYICHRVRKMYIQTGA